MLFPSHSSLPPIIVKPHDVKYIDQVWYRERHVLLLLLLLAWHPLFSLSSVDFERWKIALGNSATSDNVLTSLPFSVHFTEAFPIDEARCWRKVSNQLYWRERERETRSRAVRGWWTASQSVTNELTGLVTGRTASSVLRSHISSSLLVVVVVD